MYFGLRHIFTAALLALAAGCTAPHQSLATDVDPAAWEHAAEFTLENTDTVTLRDVRIFLTCNDRFREDTLTVHIGIRTPNRGRFEEPFRMVIPRATTPAAVMREAIIPYRLRVRFPLRGDYRLTITPCRTVRGVEAAGIHIVKSNN